MYCYLNIWRSSNYNVSKTEKKRQTILPNLIKKIKSNNYCYCKVEREIWETIFRYRNIWRSNNYNVSNTEKKRPTIIVPKLNKRLRATTIVSAKLKERFEKLSFAIAIFEGAITIMWAIQKRSDQPSLYQS